MGTSIATEGILQHPSEPEHNYIDRDYMGHTSIGHNHVGHTCGDHNCTKQAMLSDLTEAMLARASEPAVRPGPIEVDVPAAVGA